MNSNCLPFLLHGHETNYWDPCRVITDTLHFTFAEWYIYFTNRFKVVLSEDGLSGPSLHFLIPEHQEDDHSFLLFIDSKILVEQS